MTDVHTKTAIRILANFHGVTRLQVFLEEADPDPYEVRPMKRVAESSFPPPSPDDYSDQKTVGVKLGDPKYTLLYSYDACRKGYLWT
ncbi:hypothetical protein CEP53_011871 [Fusarium sp. AF-6]|nr:hypothetical protein CEP53_011871 [Fusarium sp. AF-6]